jgi:hypothetical protein
MMDRAKMTIVSDEFLCDALGLGEMEQIIWTTSL